MAFETAVGNDGTDVAIVLELIRKGRAEGQGENRRDDQGAMKMGGRLHVGRRSKNTPGRAMTPALMIDEWTGEE